MRRIYATIAGPPNATHPNRRNDVNNRRNDIVAGVDMGRDRSVVAATDFIF
ncbi:MAG: hypothetical protein HY270_23480 [Deltaproteobacteria bacterium]|nr:hypothetical protein [Deltaproteobacteria bacterium]